ncbi:hypothetical protein [Microvirga makkahensis]|uniref:Uncharacterized protein n=1 Tax=Microvirga makkahensis TaxID=1128670 RepID=A0A7X3MVB3_9HYPH|nr:hypothetical protein [Microvirga makkahensis]MXQ13630.1 hypothetical protein [Microvirga makkahensis]
MVPKTDWDAPAHLQYEPIIEARGSAHRDPSDVTEFKNLREAVHWAMNNEAPAGMHAVIRTSSGAVLGPAMLEEIWLSLQGP